jgi:signal transduction histidine kinase
VELEAIWLWVLIGSCLLHWGTVAVLIRQVWKTDKPWAWNVLALAVSVLAIQQTYGLYLQFSELAPPALHGLKELLSLLVAGLMFAGIMMLSPIVNILQRNKELLEVIDERKVIICHFHDRIAQALRQVQIAMEVGKPAHVTIEQVSEMAKMLHVFMEDLKAGVLLGSKFEIALKTLVDDVSKEGGFPIQVLVDSAIEDSISYDQGVELLHILHEAIQNSVQYSRAKKGTVSVKILETHIVFEVFDNGRGFEFDLVGAQGHGLGNMALRAKNIGARMKIHSQLKKGTTIVIELPRKTESQDSSYSIVPSTPSHETAQNILVS